MADKFNFDQIQKKLSQTKRELLVLLTNQAQNYFVESFRKQGWNGEPWEEVQRRKPGTKSYAYPKTRGLQRRTSPILIGAGYKVRGGTLRRTISTMTRTRVISENSARMVVDLPYAVYLNEGTPNMPKRQFVGQTPELTQMQTNKVNEVMARIWQV